MTNLTQLRQNIFNAIDKVIETGNPIEINRRGHKLKIVLEAKKSKLASLVKRNNVIKCSNDDLIYNNWIREWNENNND